VIIQIVTSPPLSFIPRNVLIYLDVGAINTAAFVLRLLRDQALLCTSRYFRSSFLSTNGAVMVFIGVDGHLGLLDRVIEHIPPREYWQERISSFSLS